MKIKTKVIVFLSIFILITGFITNHISNMIVHPAWHHPGLDHNCSKSQMEYAKIVCIDNPESAIREKFESIQLQTGTNSFVDGWYFPAPKKTDKIVIFVHGGGADRRNGYKLVPFLLKAGFSVLLYDSPNHGRSSNDGRGISYGIRESEAFPIAVDWAMTKAGRVYVIATSVGASTVVLSRDKWVGKIRAIVFENPLLSLERLLLASDLAKYLPEFYLSFLFDFVQLKSGFSIYDASPENYINNFPDIPVIVMHGTHDATIPFEHGKMFYEKLNVKNKQFFIAQDTDHCRVWDKYPVQFESLTLKLFSGK